MSYVMYVRMCIYTMIMVTQMHVYIVTPEFRNTYNNRNFYLPLLSSHIVIIRMQPYVHVYVCTCICTVYDVRMYICLKTLNRGHPTMYQVYKQYITVIDMFVA